MKWHNVFTFFIIFFMLSLPIAAHARSVKPDIRNYDVHVETRLMPSVKCQNKTPEEWVAEYIGFNQLAGNNMKFSEYLFEMANQVDRAAVRLAPKIFTDRAEKAANEQGNPVAWVGEICWYQPDLKPPIIGTTIIESETPITQIFKKIRDGNAQLSAFNALYHIPLSGETYPMQKSPLSPDPNKQSACPAEPPGIPQSPTTDKGQGVNMFAGFLTKLNIDVLCALPYDPCKCKDTAMYIRTDSFIPYNTPPLCTGPGCTDAQIAQVDPQSAPTELEKNAKGWQNAVVRIGKQLPIIEMVEMLFGTITGKAPQQTTINNVNERTADSSYYTTMGHEMSMKFTNCTLFPFNTREIYNMPECNTNWLANATPTPQQPFDTPTPSLTPKPPTPTPTLSIPPSTSGLHGKCEGNLPATADAFITYLYDHGILWPDYDNIRAHYAEILQASKTKGIDPGIVLAIWVEESGAGRSGPQFGCTSVNPDFQPQLECFLNLWDTYSTRSDFAECRGSDNQLSLREFMLIFEGGFKSCRSGQFGTEPAFPEQLKDWYDKLTDCQNGLEF